jgi:pimeloyl-ACP methyl ester carboxylesterase
MHLPLARRAIPGAVTLALLCVLGCQRAKTGPEPLALIPCRLEGVSKALECGEVEVWEDRAAKQGRRLTLKVAVARALAPQPEPDPLFVLAGGPGQAATEVARAVLPWLERVRRHRDIVFLDQRGTGGSHPLKCLEAPEDAPLSELLRLEPREGELEACLAGYDADVRHYTTPVAMDDLDEVRRALGYGRINLYGVSYGTRAALVYLRQHGEHVRTATLDGVAPLSLYLPLSMARDAEVVLAGVFERCRGDAACAQAFPGLEPRFRELLARLDTAPAQATLAHPRTGERVDVALHRDHLMGTVRTVLYDASATAMVPLLLDRASGGDFAPLLAMLEATGGSASGGIALGMFYSVVCAEDAPFIPPGALAREAEGTTVGVAQAERILDACAVWPRGEVPADYRQPVRSDVPVLLLSGALDPVTPPRWGEDAAKTLTRSKHVVVPGVGHNTLGQACARSLVRDFITTGSVEGLANGCEQAPGAPSFLLDFAGPTP